MMEFLGFGGGEENSNTLVANHEKYGNRKKMVQQSDFLLNLDIDFEKMATERKYKTNDNSVSEVEDLFNPYNVGARPFLKWAGGKTQLINEIHKSLPYDIREEKFTYIEPFVGSGAILFWMINNFPKMEKAVINDINADLINTYSVIASKPKDLIYTLRILQNEFHSLENKPEDKKAYYYQKRDTYNTREEGKVEQAALFIFLNRTCFNGLYRVNRSNGFNVPMGSYVNPTICDDNNIFAVSNALQKVELLCGDFENTINYTSNNSFFYFDPPYKPLSETSSFNSYAKDEFNDGEQRRLRDFCSRIDSLGHKWMLSNSDVNSKESENDFFDTLYQNFEIKRVEAKRRINANPEKRGKLNELLITNYSYEKALRSA